MTRFTRSDLALVALLLGAGLVLRVACRSEFLYHWDSVNFALALEHFDVRLHQPHPPGYILYVALGRLIEALVLDPNASLVWISVVSGVASIGAVYWLGRLVFSRAVGLTAALFTLTGPLPWFYSEIALSYALEFVMVTVFAGLCYLQFTAQPRLWPWSALLLGLMGGVRQNDLVFLFPLWLACLAPLSWSQRGASLAVLGGAIAAWLIPMASLSGGVAALFAAIRGGGGEIMVEAGFGSFHQLTLNAARMAIYLFYGTLLAAVPLLWGALQAWRLRHVVLRDPRTWLFALWIAPAAGFYFLVHLRQHGHIFTFLPAVIILCALASVQLGSSTTRRLDARPAVVLVPMLVAITNLVFFLFAPASLFGSERLPLRTPSRAAIVERDTILRERLGYIRASFKPSSTAVLADGMDFRHPDFYLRDYQLPDRQHQQGDQLAALPANVRTLVLFEEQSCDPCQINAPLQQIELPSGALIRYVTWSGEGPVLFNQSTIMLSDQARGYVDRDASR